MTEATRPTYRTAQRRVITSSDRRRENYHILGIIEKNTGGAQPAMASVTSVLGIATDNGVANARKRLRAARENDDVVICHGRVVRADRPDDLREAIGEENMREEPDREKIARLVAALEEVRVD